MRVTGNAQATSNLCALAIVFAHFSPFDKLTPTQNPHLAHAPSFDLQDVTSS